MRAPGDRPSPAASPPLGHHRAAPLVLGVKLADMVVSMNSVSYKMEASFSFELDILIEKGMAGLILGNNYHGEYPYYYLILIHCMHS